VVFTFELDSLPAWQQRYLAEGLAIERPRFPSLERIASALGGRVRVERLATPGDCVDGFFEAILAATGGTARSRCPRLAVDVGDAAQRTRAIDRPPSRR
jgi:hypothetical protein